MLSVRTRSLLVGLLHFACATAAFAGQQPGSAGQSTTDNAPTQADWRKAIMEAAPLGPGCFQVTYPSTTAKQVPCEAPPARPRLPPPKAWKKGKSEIVGNGKDYILVAPPGHTLSRVAGSFPSIKGVTSVNTVGGVTPGANSYTLQLNASTSKPTSACQGLGEHCSVWQQFAYVTPDFDSPDSSILIQYWLFGVDPCPSPFQKAFSYCVYNSARMKVPSIPATDLDKVQLWGFSYPGTYDHMYLDYKDTIYMLNLDTSVLRLGEAWSSAEFNIFGNADGGMAVFNPGSTLDVRLAAVFGGNYHVTPQCEASGSTGETNNLLLVDGSCKAWSYPNSAGVGSPYIQFSETSDGNPSVWPALTFSQVDVVPGFDKLQWTIQIQGDKPNKQGGWGWGQQSTMNSMGGYMDFNVQPSGQGRNENSSTIQFSLGGPDAVFTSHSPICTNNDNAGVTCSLPYSWILGRSYTFTAARTAHDSNQTTWTGSITDNLTGKSTVMGSISVSPSANWTLISLNSKVYAFIVTSQPFPPQFNACKDLPFMDAIISTPVGSYADSAPIPLPEDSFVGNCTLYAQLAAGQYKLQIGTAGPSKLKP